MGDKLSHNEFNKRDGLGENLVAFLEVTVGTSSGNLFVKVGEVVVVKRTLHNPLTVSCYSVGG